MYYKTEGEIELIRQSSLLVGRTLAEIGKALRPGIKTISLDKLAEDFIRSHGGTPAFKGYRGFPGSICISCNSEVVHGIPGEREVREGDVVSVDCGVYMNGFYGDSAYTFAIGELQEDVRKLLSVTRECLEKGIAQAQAGNRVGDISYAVQQHAEAAGYSVVRELVGHGVGRQLHEKPEVPNYGQRGRGPVLREGLVIAIEPMINMGKKAVHQEKDNWTIATADGMPSAHYEHTVVIRKGGAEVLSSFEMIESMLERAA